MTDEERRELAELRSTVAALGRTLRVVQDRLRALEPDAPGPGAERPATPGTGAAAGPVDATRAPVGGEAPRPRIMPSAVLPPVRRREAPAALKWLRAFLTEGNPLNKLGALSLLVGAAVVFRYAVDNALLGPTGRVAVGLGAGMALLGVGEFYARKGWQLFASGLVAAGGGLVFIATWFGHQQYGVVPSEVAFLVYIAMTAAMVAQSLRYDAQALAVWGLLGGFLAPALASTGSGNYALLGSYLLLLNAGVFSVAYRRSWHLLKWMSFAFTALYEASWVYAFVEEPDSTRWLTLQWMLPFLAAFFVTFAAIPTWRSLRLRQPVDVFDQFLTVANGVVHFFFAWAALQDQSRAWLGLVAATVALLYAVVSARAVRLAQVDPRAVRVFAGTAAAFLLLATPYLVSGPTITLVWCAQTAFLAWGCTRPRFAFLRGHVLAMLTVIVARLVEWDGLFATQLAPGERHVPLATIASWPPFAAAATFAWVARQFGRLPSVRVAPAWVMVAAALVFVAAVDGEAALTAQGMLAPLGDPWLHRLIRAGLLVTFTVGAWFGLLRSGALVVPWLGSFGLAAALLFWTSTSLLWPAYRYYGAPGSWWLHGSVLMMLPLLFLLYFVARTTPDTVRFLSGERLRALLSATTLGVVLLLLRREAHALTHAPPIADFFPDAARQASYSMLLSVSYALTAFLVYRSALANDDRARLYAAYALYGFTALKVYFFDLGAQQPLYRAFSLVAFAGILFVSSWFANRREHEAQGESA